MKISENSDRKFFVSSANEMDFQQKKNLAHTTKLHDQNRATNTIVGESAALKQALNLIERVAPTDFTVLILGETGTGKELAARAVHKKSARKNRPLIKVNCAALPGGLIESELFGHERGAFTGAATRQIGRFELAHEATVFLDEIGDLPFHLQAKLLRVLQEGEFERLGSGKTIKVDVRVIAATDRNLLEEVNGRRFRMDLYYRLNVCPIKLAPLRERREDIPLLVKMFLAEAAKRLGREFNEIPPAVCEALQDYDWPGNVRELQNVVQRAALSSTTSELRLPVGWQSTADREPQTSSQGRSSLMMS